MSTPSTPDMIASAGGHVAPHRIQRRRTSGWRMPEGAVYVGRPSKWGNPFAAPDPAVAVAAYRSWLTDPTWRWTNGPPEWLELTPWYERQSLIGQARRYNFELLWLAPVELAGHQLVCWCPLVDAEGRPVPCHADVLLEIANGGGS